MNDYLSIAEDLIRIFKGYISHSPVTEEAYWDPAAAHLAKFLERRLAGDRFVAGSRGLDK